MIIHRLSLIFLVLFLTTGTIDAQTTRGAGNIKIKKSNGKTEEIKLYDANYALVIGEKAQIS